MEHIGAERPTWREALSKERPLLLPVAHDGLSARIIHKAGFTAYQIGGFATEGSRHGVPDVDLTHFAERHAAVRDIIACSPLPVMVDADDGYGDVKNVTHTVRHFEALGVSAIFIEDQKPPKKCGHMSNKECIPKKDMVKKVRAAVAAKRNAEDIFIVARTDAIQPEGLSDALRRAEAYLEAGADGIYVEGPTSEKELRKIGETFKGVPLATSVLENGGETPWLSPKEFGDLGFSMILYPTTIIFQVARAIQLAAATLRGGQPLDASRAVNMEEFLKIVDLEHWQKIEKEFD